VRDTAEFVAADDKLIFSLERGPVFDGLVFDPAPDCIGVKSGLKAQTVHSLFYKLVDKGVDEQTGKRILVAIPDCVFVNGGTIDDYDDDDFTSALDYGWCLTVHKSQGSEWDKVLLIDENHKYDRRRLADTGISRAAKSIIVQG
jgi:hypothetical protein